MTSRRSLSSIFSQSLGELELQIMGILWQWPDTDAKTVAQRIERGKPPTLSTVQSTLERLHKKKLVSRSKRGQAYYYRPEVSRSELLGKLMSQVIRLLHDGKMDTILSSFVNVAADLDQRALDDLEQLIASKREQEQAPVRKEGGTEREEGTKDD
jgi:predicted transcriptional regulator